MPLKKIHSMLQLRGLELSVNLGWRKKERGAEQAVLLDIDIHFPHAPQACLTDDLQDTVCYAQLIQAIRLQSASKHFHLIEHLATDIYHFVKTHLPTNTKISVRITKYPKIAGLTGGACFCYEDT